MFALVKDGVLAHMLYFSPFYSSQNEQIIIFCGLHTYLPGTPWHVIASFFFCFVFILFFVLYCDIWDVMFHFCPLMFCELFNTFSFWGEGSNLKVFGAIFLDE